MLRKVKPTISLSILTTIEPILRLAASKVRAVTVQKKAVSRAANSPVWRINKDLMTGKPAFGVLYHLAFPYLEMQFCLLFIGIRMDFPYRLPGCNFLAFLYVNYFEV